MTRVGMLAAPFDPITAAELKYARAIMKQGHYDLMVLVIQGEGVLSKDVREELVRFAIKPYRHMAVGESDNEAEYLTMPNCEAGEAEVRTGRFDLAAPGIRRIMAENGFYFEEILDHWCNPHRAAHARATAELCRELAQAHGLDGGEAWRAGMLHDITKNREDSFNKAILEVHDPDKLSYSPKVWHSFTAPVWLSQNLVIRDKKLLHAIYCHTIGDGGSDLDRIVYIADKTEPTRGYDSTAEIGLCKRDLKEGFRLVKAEVGQYLEKEGIHE